MRTVDEDLETLTWLGLTERQAKIFLALLQTDSAGTDEISKLSCVHRQDIYRVLDSLQEIGLVETKLAFPMRFSAVSVEEALKILVEKKKWQFDNIHLKIQQMLKRFEERNLQTLKRIEKPYFNIIHGGGNGRRLQCAIENSCKSIEIVTGAKRFHQGFSYFDNEFKDLLGRGVLIRVITESCPTFPECVSKL
jgi:sugar-specific transcriptional regulator TrmB